MKKKQRLSLVAAIFAFTGSACARELPDHSLLIYGSAHAQPHEIVGAGFLLEHAPGAACDVDTSTLRARANGVDIVGDDVVIDGCGASGFVALDGRQPGDVITIELDVDGAHLEASAVIEPALLVVSNGRVTPDAPLALAYDGPTHDGAALSLDVRDGDGDATITTITVPLEKHMRVDARDLPGGNVKVSAESAIAVDVDACRGVGACSALDLARVEMPIVVQRL